MPTGTMANQIGVRLHVHGSGHLVAATSGAHVASTELMTSAVLSGITFRTGDPGPRAWMTADLARELVEAEDPYDVEVVDLIAVENTVGHAGGTVMPVEEIRAIRKVADDNDLPIHLDGARIFNAAVAAGVDVTEYTREADTMMFCVSKGLGAPIGSLRVRHPRGHPRGTAAQDPVRRRVAAGRHHGGGRSDRPGGRTETAPPGPRAGPASRGSRGRDPAGLDRSGDG